MHMVDGGGGSIFYKIKLKNGVYIWNIKCGCSKPQLVGMANGKEFENKIQDIGIIVVFVVNHNNEWQGWRLMELLPIYIKGVDECMWIVVMGSTMNICVM